MAQSDLSTKSNEHSFTWKENVAPKAAAWSGFASFSLARQWSAQKSARLGCQVAVVNSDWSRLANYVVSLDQIKGLTIWVVLACFHVISLHYNRTRYGGTWQVTCALLRWIYPLLAVIKLSLQLFLPVTQARKTSDTAETGIGSKHSVWMKKYSSENVSFLGLISLLPWIKRQQDRKKRLFVSIAPHPSKQSYSTPNTWCYLQSYIWIWICCRSQVGWLMKCWAWPSDLITSRWLRKYKTIQWVIKRGNFVIGSCLSRAARLMSNQTCYTQLQERVQTEWGEHNDFHVHLSHHSWTSVQNIGHTTCRIVPKNLPGRLICENKTQICDGHSCPV